MLREGFNEAVSTGRIVFRIVEELEDLDEGYGAAIDDGVLYMQVSLVPPGGSPCGFGHCSLLTTRSRAGVARQVGRDARRHVQEHPRLAVGTRTRAGPWPACCVVAAPPVCRLESKDEVLSSFPSLSSRPVHAAPRQSGPSIAAEAGISTRPCREAFSAPRKSARVRALACAWRIENAQGPIQHSQ